MKSLKSKGLIYLAIILFPIQVLHIPIRTTTIDFTSIILLFTFIVLILNSDFKKNRELLIFFSFFSLVQLIFFFFSPAPFFRFLSSFTWISLFIFFIFNKEIFFFDYKVAEKLIKITLSIAIIISWFQYFFIIGPGEYNLGVKLRAQGLFLEPSYAGLAYYSASAAYLGLYFIGKKNYKNILYSLIFFITGFLTLSMHIVTFFIVISIIYFLLIIKYLSLKKIKLSLVILTITFFLIYILFNYFSFSFLDIFINHFYKRINFVNIDTSSLSLLAWLQGFDQMSHSLKSNFILGMGLGSTGEFYFPSTYKDILANLNAYGLTMKDSFSLFFRLIIEIGVVLTLCFLLYCVNKTLHFINNIGNQSYQKYIFCFIFSMSLIVGSLIKEPNFARSTLVLGIMLFANVPNKSS